MLKLKYQFKAPTAKGDDDDDDGDRSRWKVEDATRDFFLLFRPTRRHHPRHGNANALLERQQVDMASFESGINISTLPATVFNRILCFSTRI